MISAGLILVALLGLPLFVLIAWIALIAFQGAEIDASAIIIELYRMASQPVLVAIPLFTFAGFVMAESGLPRRIIRLSHAALSWLPGGLALMSLLACALFTAFTGASGVTIIALGGLLFPILVKEGYPERFSLGLMTTSGSLGLLFPPSLPLILYGLVAGVSVDDLFRAALLPGLLILLILGAYAVWVAGRAKLPRQPFSGAELKGALREAAWELPIPPLVLVLIYGGFVTPAEAAAVTAVVVLVVEGLIQRELPWRKLLRLGGESMAMVGAVLAILGVALGLTNFLVDAEVPQRLLEWMQSWLGSRGAFLLMLNLFLLVVGCLMDIFSAIIVVVPLIVPVAESFGVSPLHLGVIFMTNLEIGYLTPPVGLNLFLGSYRFQRPVLELYRASLVFLLLLLLALALVTWVPWLSLWGVGGT
ncbi:MAG: TRAP transporter large permease subunit [Candidatus Delongbacteria bacterium]